MIGNRILTAKQKVSKKTIDAFSKLPVANVSDCMGRIFAGGASLRPMHREGSLCGPALTVRGRPGDNLFLHKAIDIAEPGDVIVMDAGGDLTNALMGELMLAHAIKRGVAGFVLNGAIRDVADFQKENLPTYAAGITHRGPYKHGPGEINTTIALDGMTINPGDLIIGDLDGVLCVPFEMVDDILEAANKKQAIEQEQMKKIRNGTINRDWIDIALHNSGCAFPE